MRKFITKLKIADLIVYLHSRFPLELEKRNPNNITLSERYDNFLYFGKRKHSIEIRIEITNKLPDINMGKSLFRVYHFQGHQENWSLFKDNERYVYICPLEQKKQMMLINNHFNKVIAYLQPKKELIFKSLNQPLEDKNGKLIYAWNKTDIIYDFLQVLLINYFSQRKSGLIVHSVGIKDTDGKGYLFCGKSGAGKSTAARIWYKHSKATVLNDDRIIINKKNSNFFIHGSPWHGDFSDYLTSKLELANLNKIFFIYHSKKNTAERISVKNAFCFLYPSIFPTFWDANGLKNISFFCQKLIKNVPCYRLGLRNDESTIDFVRKI